MIFVTVGTHDQGFERLVKKMDEIAGQIDEEVVIQVGYTDYEPVNANWFKFVNMEEIMDFYQKARIIITHAGAGTLLDCFEFNKPILVVPRLKKFDEHIDDQQLELAEALENQDMCKSCINIEILKDIIENCTHQKNNLNSEKNLIKFLKSSLRGI